MQAKPISISDGANLPPLGVIRSVQVPGGFIQLGKVVDNQQSGDMWFTLIYWIDVRRDAEWVPTFSVPGPYE